MEKSCGPALRQVTSPPFATYATLQRGIGYEREYAAWCRWVAEQLERGADTPDAVEQLEQGTDGRGGAGAARPPRERGKRRAGARPLD